MTEPREKLVRRLARSRDRICRLRIDEQSLLRADRIELHRPCAGIEPHLRQDAQRSDLCE